MNELLKLLDSSHNWPYQPSFYVTTLDAVTDKLKRRGQVHVIGECNRRCPMKLFGVFARSLKIVIKHRPDVVITTGSLPLAILCLSAKLFGAKIVWIDSVANIERFSMSGRMMLRFADLFLTQWPELAEKCGKAEYAGSLI